MILVADSGSTKTNWLAADGKLIQTVGLNPLFYNTEKVLEVLHHSQLLVDYKPRITQVYFYGASCSSPERNRVIEEALSAFFENAQTIVVEHDLMAAALATYTGVPGIACILGTGSNSCVYDGEEIYEEVPSLGYVLGDEGGGVWFGKELLRLLMYKKLPKATEEIMLQQYHLDKEVIIQHVYREPSPNRWMAQFAKVMTESTDAEFMRELAKRGFEEFFKYHVMCYTNATDMPVHFVGSIAWHYKDALNEVAQSFGCKLGIVEPNPIHRLLAYHQKA